MYVHLYRTNEIKQDKKNLRTLLLWCRKHNLRADVQNAFSIDRWDELGQFMWAAAIGDDMVAIKSLPTRYKKLQTAGGTAIVVAALAFPQRVPENFRTVPLCLWVCFCSLCPRTMERLPFKSVFHVEKTARKCYSRF